MDIEKEINEIAEIISTNRNVEDSQTIAKMIVKAGYRKAEELYKKINRIISEVRKGIENASIVTEGDEYSFSQGYNTQEVDEVISYISRKYGV